MKPTDKNGRQLNPVLGLILFTATQGKGIFDLQGFDGTVSTQDGTRTYQNLQRMAASATNGGNSIAAPSFQSGIGAV